jgi:hypothetical protein
MLDITKYLFKVYQGSVLITMRLLEVEISHLVYITKLRDIYNSLKILLTTLYREGLTDSKSNSI